MDAILGLKTTMVGDRRVEVGVELGTGREGVGGWRTKKSRVGGKEGEWGGHS